jgi:hypothetical protein
LLRSHIKSDRAPKQTRQTALANHPNLQGEKFKTQVFKDKWMRRNLFWILFISVIFLGVLGYTTHTLIKVWQYMRLDQQTQAQDIRWSILSSNEEAFVPFANYSFIVQDKSYQGQTRWQETYLNQWTAQEAIMRLEHAPPLVWYDSSSPEISSLQKKFPLKESIYTLMLLILGVYFIGLGYYVNVSSTFKPLNNSARFGLDFGILFARNSQLSYFQEQKPER